jgi:hypothetical protein
MKLITKKILAKLGFIFGYYETVKTNNWDIYLNNKCIYQKTHFIEDDEIRVTKMPLLKIIKLYFLGK